MSRSAKPQNGRRRFCAMSFAQQAGWLPWVWRWGYNSKPHAHLACGCARRAINENAFASACVRCGQCVQACPYDTLKLATLASGLSAGTPYFVARDIPCEMCEDIPCAKVCPSGALDREDRIDRRRADGAGGAGGRGKLSQLSGLRCDVCYRECPKIDEAITTELERNTRTGKHARFLPTVHSDACTGCGKCEKSVRAGTTGNQGVTAVTGRKGVRSPLPLRLAGGNNGKS